MGRAAFGKLVGLLLEELEAYFIEPECVHWSECNGCKLMVLPYEKQLVLKERLLAFLFGKRVPLEPAQQKKGYRNYVELSLIGDSLGFRRKGSVFESFSMRQCLLVSREVNKLIRFLSREIPSGFESADLMQRVPGLRYVALRENREKEFLLNLVFFGGVGDAAMRNAVALWRGLRKRNVRSLNLLVNKTWSDTASGGVVETFGERTLIERLLGRRFLIKPNVFFQTNTLSAERVFSDAIQEIGENASLLDLFSGIGTIGIIAARKCSRVLCIESNPESVALAKENAELNGVENVGFVEGLVQRLLGGLGREFDMIVVNPPREGLNRKTIKAIKEINPWKIIYVSCNPETLARDVAGIDSHKVTKIKAFDQFPHTPHLEMLCVMERME